MKGDGSLIQVIKYNLLFNFRMYTKTKIVLVIFIAVESYQINL